VSDLIQSYEWIDSYEKKRNLPGSMEQGKRKMLSNMDDCDEVEVEDDFKVSAIRRYTIFSYPFVGKLPFCRYRFVGTVLSVPFCRYRFVGTVLSVPFCFLFIFSMSL
jgi:hypothetical protein